MAILAPECTCLDNGHHADPPFSVRDAATAARNCDFEIFGLTWRRRPWSLPRRLIPALAAGALLALLLAGCGQNGEATKSGPQIISASAHALLTARSYRLQGTVPVSGGTGSFTFEVGGPHLGSGTFTLGSLTFQLREIRGTDYVKSATLWEQADGGALQGFLANKWVSIPADNSLAQTLTTGLAALTSAKQEAQVILKGESRATRGKTSTFAGQGVVEVTEGSGNSATKVLVATSGPPFPLRVDGRGQDYLDLSDFNQNFKIAAPAGAVSLVQVLAGLNAGFGSGTRN